MVSEEEVLEFFKDKCFYEVAEVVLKDIKPKMEKDYNYIDLEELERGNGEYYSFYLAVYRMVNY